MTSGEQLGWRVAVVEVERAFEAMEREYGGIEPYARVYYENAMREFMDDGPANDLESTVDSLLSAAGLAPSESAEQKKYGSKGRETLKGEETVLINRRINPDLKEGFMAVTKEHTSLSYGLAFGYALREYREARQLERLTKRLERNEETLTEMLESVDSGESDLPSQEREAIEIARELSPQFKRTELRKKIIEVTGRDSSYIINDRTRRVLEHGYAPHPSNRSLIVPEEEARTVQKANKAHEWAEYREEQLEDGEWKSDTLEESASEEFDELMSAQPARTDGGTEHTD